MWNLYHQSLSKISFPVKERRLYQCVRVDRTYMMCTWLYMKVSRTSFCVATFSRSRDNVVYVAMSSQRSCDVHDVKKRPVNFHIQPNIQVLSTSGFDGRRLADWATSMQILGFTITITRISIFIHALLLNDWRNYPITPRFRYFHRGVRVM